MKHSILLISLLFSLQIFAAGLDLENNDTVENQPLNISGDYSVPKKLSRVDRMKLMRKKIEKQNEELMRKQIEKMRYMSEIKMMKRIQKTFDDNLKKIDQI